MKTHEYVGWALISAVGVLFAAVLAPRCWSEPASPLALIPFAILLFGLLGVPGMIILKRRWSDLANVLAGVISIITLSLLITHTNSWAAKVLRGREDSLLFSLLALSVCVLPFAASVWIYRKLKPRIQTLFPKAK